MDGEGITKNKGIIKPKKKKRGVGRPTDFKKKYCQDIIDHMKKGGTKESFGAYLGKKYGDEYAVCKNTVFNWINNHPEFLGAVSIGESYARYHLEKIGMKGIKGQLKYVKRKWISDDGSVSKSYDKAVFNARAYMFEMCNRFGMTMKSEVDHKSSDGSVKSIVNINLPRNGRELDSNG